MRWPKASLRRCAGNCSIVSNGRRGLPHAVPSLSTLKFGITGIVVIPAWAISVHCSLSNGCVQQPKPRVYKIGEGSLCPLCLCGSQDSQPKITTETQRTQRLHREINRAETFRAKPLEPITGTTLVF